ncbi:MAG: hypothetical protein ACFFFH_14245 [Candidatus Thorarchaeota archaeon]
MGKITNQTLGTNGEQIFEQKPSVKDVIELTQLGDLIDRMINKRIYRKEEEVLDYATKAKEILSKWEK